MTSTSCFSIASANVNRTEQCVNRITTVKYDFRKWRTPALKKKFMFCYCNEICKEGRCTSVPLYHTGQCKSTGGYLQCPGVGFFRTGAGQNAIPTVIIMFV